MSLDLSLESDSVVDLREAVFQAASRNNWPILALQQKKLSLEEVFRTLTQTSEDRLELKYEPIAG